MSYGQDLLGKLVSNAAAVATAQAQLRSPTGHNPTSASSWANPPSWWTYDQGLSLDDPTKPSGRSMQAQVTQLIAAGIEPLVVQWVRPLRLKLRPDSQHRLVLLCC
jgi:hypothetical protein